MSAQGWTDAQDLDFDNVSDTPPPPVEDGVYMLKITRAEAQQTKKGKPAFVLDLQVEREFSGADISERSKNIKYQTFTLDKTVLFRVKNLIKGLGVAGPKNTSYEEIERFCGDILGQEVWGKVRGRERNGKIYPEVDRYLTAEQAQDVVNGVEPDAGAGAGNEPAKPRARRRG